MAIDNAFEIYGTLIHSLERVGCLTNSIIANKDFSLRRDRIARELGC